MIRFHKLLIIFVILSLSINIGAGKVNFGGWGGLPSPKFSSIGGSNPFTKPSEFAFFMSVRGGFILNNFILGASFNVLANKIPYDCKRTGVDYGDLDNDDGWGSSDTEACSDFENPELDFFYISFVTGYNLQVSEKFKIEFLNSFGFGIFQATGYDGLFGGEEYEQTVFVYEPEVSFQIVPVKFFAIAFNFSYRIPAVLKIGDHIHYSAADISGPSAGLELRFGYFNYKKW